MVALAGWWTTPTKISNWRTFQALMERMVLFIPTAPLEENIWIYYWKEASSWIQIFNGSSQCGNTSFIFNRLSQSMLDDNGFLRDIQPSIRSYYYFLWHRFPMVMYLLMDLIWVLTVDTFGIGGHCLTLLTRWHSLCGRSLQPTQARMTGARVGDIESWLYYSVPVPMADNIFRWGLVQPVFRDQTRNISASSFSVTRPSEETGRQ